MSSSNCCFLTRIQDSQEAGKVVYEDLQDLLELIQKKKKKKALFIIGDWNSKVGRQEIPGVVG